MWPLYRDACFFPLLRSPVLVDLCMCIHNLKIEQMNKAQRRYLETADFPYLGNKPNLIFCVLQSTCIQLLSFIIVACIRTFKLMTFIASFLVELSRSVWFMHFQYTLTLVYFVLQDFGILWSHVLFTYYVIFFISNFCCSHIALLIPAVTFQDAIITRLVEIFFRLDSNSISFSDTLLNRYIQVIFR